MAVDCWCTSPKEQAGPGLVAELLEAQDELTDPHAELMDSHDCMADDTLDCRHCYCLWTGFALLQRPAQQGSPPLLLGYLLLLHLRLHGMQQQQLVVSGFDVPYAVMLVGCCCLSTLCCFFLHKL